MLKAKDLMTKDVLRTDKDERLPAVLDLLVKHRVSKLVVTEKGRCVGVIADGDIADELGALKNRGVATSQLHASSVMRRQYPKAAPDTELPHLLADLTEHDAGIVPVLVDEAPVGVVTASDLLSLVRAESPLADVMTSRLVVVSPDDRVIHARRLMIDHGIERLPVLDRGKLVGILGEIDVAVGLARLKDTVAEHHQSSALQRFLVEDIYQRTLVTANPDTTAREAVELLREEDVGSLPVVRGDQIVGIVTRTDLLKLIPRDALVPPPTWPRA